MVPRTSSCVPKLLRFLFCLYFLPVVFLSAVILAGLQLDLSFALFTRDPAAVAGMHPFVGVASNLGIVLWSAAATLCLFSGAVLWRNDSKTRTAAYFFCSGCLTVILLLDDLFLLHEGLSGRCGVPDTVIYLGYAGLILCGVVLFRKCILETDYLVLLPALGFFGLSVLVDHFSCRIEASLGQWRILIEDGLKFLGIVGWFGYFFKSCLAAVRGRDHA